MADLKPESILVATGRPEGAGQPLNVPLVPSSNFILGKGPVYSREDGTPTWRALESVVGALEGGEAVSFSSGMAAAAALLELVPGGGSVVLPQDCYQGVAGLAESGAEKGRWRLRRLATDDTEAWMLAAQSDDLLVIESPSNPRLILADLAAICSAARRPGCLLAVDNTFATPLNQQPLALGADLVLHSATKFIGGHSDLLGGLLVTGDADLHAALLGTRRLAGATPGALEAFLAVRGIRTLGVRLERAQENAARIANFLDGHARVTSVRYPGLSSHPQHELARAQLAGFGAVIAFEVRGDAATADAVCHGTQLIQHATSLGGVETTMERRAAHGGQEHIPPTLLRISVGIEDAEDLVRDLDRALSLAA